MIIIDVWLLVDGSVLPPNGSYVQGDI